MSDIVSATLLYFVPPKDGSRPYTIINANPEPSEQPSNFGSEPQEMQIENVRGKEHEYNLDNAGFLFATHASAYTKFTDDDEIKRDYYPESAELLKKLTGANHVVLFDHIVRRHRPGQMDSSDYRHQPVPRVHVDQTPAAAERRVYVHAPELAPELLKRRYQIINLWRPISHPAVDAPLALCDYRSIDWNKDLIPTTLHYPTRDGEAFGVKHNPNHKWKYLRSMRPDEVVLIKCSDSQMDGSVAILTPHTAFVDPTTPEGTPLRESIELRALVFYGDLPYTSSASSSFPNPNNA